MAITNEATIRVKIDGTEAEVSIQDLGKAIQNTMSKARVEADKAKSAFSRLGDFSQKFFFTFKSFGMIINQFSRFSRMALEAGKMGGVGAEQYQRFTKSIEQLKIQGGMLITNFMQPIMSLTSKLAEWLGKLDQKTVTLVGSIGLTGIAIAKLIPLLRALGVTSKAALGWIGLIITAFMFLYTAWTTNLWGLRTALTGFWEFLKMWADQIGTTLSALGKIIEGVLTFSGTKIKQGWNELKASFVDTWRAAFEKVKKDGETKLLPNVKPAFKLLGIEAAQEFLNSFKKELQAKLPNPYSEWAKLAKGKSAPELEKNPLEGKLPEPKKSVFWDYIEMFDEFGNASKNAFNAVGNSMQMLGDRLTQALWNTKTRFKDLWQAMAMDFTRIFVNHVLATLAKFLAFKVLGNIVPGLGSAVTAISAVAPNASISGGNIGNIENQLTALNSNISKLATPATVNNFIQGRQLYDAVKWQRNKELMRRGRDVNNELF